MVFLRIDLQEPIWRNEALFHWQVALHIKPPPETAVSLRGSAHAKWFCECQSRRITLLHSTATKSIKDILFSMWWNVKWAIVMSDASWNTSSLALQGNLIKFPSMALGTVSDSAWCLYMCLTLSETECCSWVFKHKTQISISFMHFCFVFLSFYF